MILFFDFSKLKKKFIELKDYFRLKYSQPIISIIFSLLDINYPSNAIIVFETIDYSLISIKFFENEMDPNDTMTDGIFKVNFDREIIAHYLLSFVNIFIIKYIFNFIY